MSGLAHSFLTNSQPLAVRPWFGRATGTLRVWRRRIRERRALAELSPRELADFGATTADAYRELSTPFWR